MSDYSLQEISHEAIHPLWTNGLWPSRPTKELYMSAMLYGGGYDSEISKKYRPRFWGIYHQNRLVAVNSGFQTSPHHYRSRGLYVEEEFRRRGLATMLLGTCHDEARRLGCSTLWSFARLTALSAYLHAGFQRRDENIYRGDFGQNVYVFKSIVISP